MWVETKFRLQRKRPVKRAVLAFALPAIADAAGAVRGALGVADLAALQGHQRLVPHEVGLGAALVVGHGADRDGREAVSFHDVLLVGLLERYGGAANGGDLAEARAVLL